MKKLSVFLAIILLVGILFVSGCNSTASTETSTERLIDSQPFFPVDIDPSRAAYLDWIKDFEELTDGRYNVEQTWGGVLGTLETNYDTVLSGRSDFGMFIPKDSDRSFPMSEVVTLPFGFSPADIRTEAWLEVFRKGYFEEEYSDVKVILMAAGTCTDDLLTVSPVNSMADLKGMKIAVSGGVSQQEIIKAMGATPVFATPMDVSTMLERGIVDGLFMSSYGLYMNQYAEYVKYFYPQVRFTSIVEAWVLNKDAYNRMPEDVKAIVDDMSVMKTDKYSMNLARIEAQELDAVLDKFLSTTGTEIYWGEEDVTELSEICSLQFERWISDKTAMGYPAKEVVDEYYNNLKELGVENPSIGYTP